MTYQVIARKWRPQTFDEVTGQEPITRTLRNAIEHQRLHHAYLLSGSRGVGKTTTARLLAKALNCHKSDKPTASPCASTDESACKSCREITEGRSNDVREIDAASNTGVDNVRVIIDSVAIGAAAWQGRSRYKVFIIDEVHMLSGAAFNALLKTIEEPPPQVVFIMATTERHKVPETILSRCQQFEFRTIAAAKILERLKTIAKAEGLSIPDEALREIARAGEGSMRDAQSAMDQVISFAGAEISKADVEMALGVVGADILSRIIDGIAGNKPAEALAVIDEIVMTGHDLRNFCRDLLAHLRDLLVSKVSASEELLESAVCDAKELKRQAGLFSESDLVRFFHSLAETETKLRTAAHPRYQLEIGIVKLMEMRRVETVGEILQRLSALEASLSGESRPAQTKAPAGPASSSPGSSGKRAGGGSSSNSKAAGSFFAATAVQPAFEKESTPKIVESGALLGEITPRNDQTTNAVSPPAANIERLKAVLESKRKMFLVTVLDAARKATFEADELHIEFGPEARHCRDTLIKAENIKILREACQEMTGKQTGVRLVVQDPATQSPPTTKEEDERDDKQRLRETAESNPIVQEMLRKFRGEIVDVRRIDGDL